jgi:3-oxoacyl-(acyl-carrier-protein) synthase
VEAIATLLALRDRIAPPTLNYNAFGFGGHNAVLCLEAA